MKSPDSLTQPAEISPQEWLSLNQFLYKIKDVKSQCISVYYPYGKGSETISLLQSTKRKDSLEKIEIAIEKRIKALKNNPSSAGKFTKTLCIFGWLKDGKAVTKEIGTSKALPYIYMESKKPYTRPFEDILKTNRDVFLAIIDQKSAKLQKFHGNQIISESSLKIDLRSRHKKGGQSQGRFMRARQTKIHVFFKKVAKRLRDMSVDSELILIGGPGQAKEEFFDEIDSSLKGKCRFSEGLSFTTSQDNIYSKIISHLQQHRKKHVLEILERYDKLVKDGLTAKRNEVIDRALKAGAVDTIIVSANYQTDSQFKKILRMLETAQKTSCRIEFATNPKIIQRLKIHDSVLAILRYKIK